MLGGGGGWVRGIGRPGHCARCAPAPPVVDRHWVVCGYGPWDGEPGARGATWTETWAGGKQEGV